MNKHYLYVYLNPLKPGNYIYGKFIFEHEPFYIGKGVNNRLKSHIIESYSSKKSLKLNIIRKIIKSGNKPIIIKLYENISDYSAKRIEIYLINLIGRISLNKGPLSNLTSGGEGLSGYNLSQLSKDKISKSLNGIKQSKETIEKRKKSIEDNGGVWNKGLKGCQVSSNKGKNLSVTTKDKIRNKLIGLKQSEDTINKRKLTNKERYNGAWNKGFKTGKLAHNIKSVFKLDLEGNVLKEYNSVKLAREDNPNAKTIIRVCNGINKQSGGFKWQWKE